MTIHAQRALYDDSDLQPEYTASYESHEQDVKRDDELRAHALGKPRHTEPRTLRGCGIISDTRGAYWDR